MAKYVNIPMDVFYNIYAFMVQRRRCCSFDSPGLARNEPTPGKRSQGDSTLYALRLLGENIVFASSCVSILGPTP